MAVASALDREPKIELLVSDGCPSKGAVEQAIRAVLGELNVTARVEQRVVRDRVEAEQLGFLGSPTVRVDGVDVEPGAQDRRDFGLG